MLCLIPYLSVIYNPADIGINVLYVCIGCHLLSFPIAHLQRLPAHIHSMGSFNSVWLVKDEMMVLLYVYTFIPSTIILSLPVLPVYFILLIITNSMDFLILRTFFFSYKLLFIIYLNEFSICWLNVKAVERLDISEKNHFFKFYL